MICTVYNNIQHITEPKLYDVDVVLGWIRDCRIKDKIEKLRKTTDLELNRKLKSELPSIVFAGTFTNRTDEHCEALSGLAILDFDHLADVEATKKELAKKPYIYAAFVSPNGDGVKALARIPKQFARFAGYYRGLQKHHPELDPKNKNISRVCFLSCDPNIYINKDATEFTEYVEEPKSADRPIYHNEIKIEDTSIIIQNLFKWWSGKYQMTAGNRNHNIFVLASAFNEYGVTQHEALYFCYQYQQEDFTEKEIEQTVKSAYRKTNLHGTKEFTAVEKLANYSPKEIPTQPEAELSLPQQIFNSAFVDVSKKLDYPKPAISIGYHTTGGNNYPTSFGTYGNFSAIVGASKSRKTFFKSLLVSAYVGGQSDRYLGHIKGHRDSGQFVIDIDTEQGEWHAQNVFKRIPKMCGGNPDFYKPFALRPYSHLERIQFIDYLVYESQYKDNIGLMVIDGLADLVADFNDLKETNLLIQKVMKWTDDKKLHLMTIIHQNSYTNKATGHLGSSILKKAETVCNLAIVDDMAQVTFSYTRGFPIDKVYFKIDEDGLPFVGDTPPPASNLKKIDNEKTPF
jgi:hypothetical protein